MLCRGCQKPTLPLWPCGAPGLDDDRGCYSKGRPSIWWCGDCLDTEGLCPQCHQEVLAPPPVQASLSFKERDMMPNARMLPEAVPTKLSDGSWGARTDRVVVAGDPIQVKARTRSWRTTVSRVIFRGHGYCLVETAKGVR